MLPGKAPRTGRPALVPARPLSAARASLTPGACVALTAVALIATPFAIAACSDDETSDTADAASDPGARLGPTRIVVSLDADGSGGEPRHTERLSCEAAPSPTASACAEVARLSPRDFRPVSEGAICTEIYGGPDVATVSGVIEGRRIEAVFTRTNGCEIDRFAEIAELLRKLFPGYRPGEALAP